MTPTGSLPRILGQGSHRARRIHCLGGRRLCPARIRISHQECLAVMLAP